MLGNMAICLLWAAKASGTPQLMIYIDLLPVGSSNNPIKSCCQTLCRKPCCICLRSGPHNDQPSLAQASAQNRHVC